MRNRAVGAGGGVVCGGKVPGLVLTGVVSGAGADDGPVGPPVAPHAARSRMSAAPVSEFLMQVRRCLTPRGSTNHRARGSAPPSLGGEHPSPWLRTRVR